MPKIPNPYFCDLPKEWQTEDARFINVPSESLHAAEMIYANGVSHSEMRLAQLKENIKDLHAQRRYWENQKDESVVRGHEAMQKKQTTTMKMELGYQRMCKCEAKKVSLRIGDLTYITHYLEYKLAAGALLLPSGSIVESPAQTLAISKSFQERKRKNSRFIDESD